MRAWLARLSPRTLFGQNVALLAALLLAMQLGTLAFAAIVVVFPQSRQGAIVMAQSISALADALPHLPQERRAALIDRLAHTHTLELLPGDQPPSAAGRRWPNFQERIFMRVLARELGGERGIDWRTDQRRRLWVRLKLGDEVYWMTSRAPRRFGPAEGLALGALAAFAAAFAAGVLLQRRLARPLEDLARAADAVTLSGRPNAVAVGGPQEVADVGRAFNEMIGRLDRSERERAEMLAGVSHDIRTPLAKLRLALEMMQGPDAELEAMATRQIGEIDRMVGQFLDFARDAASEAIAPSSLRTLALEVAANYPGTASVSALSACVLPVRREAVRRALVNLVENAHRHGAPPVTITVAGDETGATVTVKDHGAGAPEAFLSRAAEPFTRGDSARCGAGTGLGLAIARRAAESHGGRLELENLADGGFAARLRLAAAPGKTP